MCFDMEVVPVDWSGVYKVPMNEGNVKSVIM